MTTPQPELNPTSQQQEPRSRRGDAVAQWSKAVAKVVLYRVGEAARDFWASYQSAGPYMKYRTVPALVMFGIFAVFYGLETLLGFR